MGKQMTPYEKQNELNYQWLKTLSGEQADQAKKGLDAGFAWAIDGELFDTVKAVALFYRIAYVGGETPDGELWDSNHDALFDHYHTLMEEAVGDDATFEEVQENEWSDPFYQGFMRGVCLVFEDMTPTTEQINEAFELH